MKKLFYSLFALAMTAMTFTSCEDVPMPYDDPNKNPGGADTEEAVEPAGSGTAEDPYNVAAIVELVQGMEADVESKEFYIKGKISSITEEYGTQYGNGTFYISDTGSNGGTKFYIYQAYYLGNKKFANGDVQIKVGDEVIILGKVYNYRGSTPETVRGKAFLYSLNGVTAGGGGSATGIEVTCAKAVELTNALTDNASSSETYSVTGYITEVVGNVSKNQQTFWMADTKDGGKVFEAYWANLPEGVSEFKAGMKVKITGNLMKYVNANTGNVTAEMKNPVVEILEDGGGGGTPTGTEINCAKAVELTNALADGGTSSETYSVTGYITEVVGNVSKNQQTFWMADTKDGGKVFEAYWANLPDGVSEFKAGMKVKITGNLMKYVKDGNVTPEIKNATVVILEEGGGGGTPSGEVKSVSIADFNAASESNDVWYQLKGKVTNLKDGDQYGNFDLVDATGSVYVYGLLSEKGGEKKKFQELVAAKGIKEGSTITIIGNRGSYSGKIEVMNAYFVSIDDQGGGGGGQETPSGLGTYEKPLSFAEAMKADNSEKPWAWVKAVIVGYVSGKTYADGAKFGADGCDTNTNIIIAGSASANNPDNCMPVQLPSGALRNGLNLKDNPSLLGKEIIIYGQLDKYFSVQGIKSPKYAEAGGNSFGTKP